MKILFLDVDGVLNTKTQPFEDGGLHEDKLTFLETLIHWTDCKIVLSSAWRYMGCGRHSVFAQCVYGVTNNDTIVRAIIGHTGPEPNGPEDRDVTIKRWLANNKQPMNWAAVDNLPCILNLAPNAVQTDERRGLTMHNLYELYNILR